MSEFKRVLPNGTEVTALGRVDDDGRVQTANISTKFREAFESYTPNGSRWAEDKASGDIVMVDGNAVGASYLVISKDPLVAGTETTVVTQNAYDMPIELSAGLHMSQRALGQEFSVELVSEEEALPATPDIAVANISQATTTLTVNTNVAHNLKPGQRIGIYGNPDSRFNYPSVVVASIPTPTQFTVTAGPGGTITSLTAGPVNGGFVYVRASTGYARNAVSMIFENASAVNASFYAKSEAGDVLPAGGTMAGSHSATVGTTASIQAINAAYTYAFAPTTEYRLSLMADRFQWSDVSVDSAGASSNRSLRTQIVPDPTKRYKLRFRATNNKGLTIPVGKIVSATKAGSTTATVVTDVAHGLTVNDQIVIYGNRDTTNFANLTTATAVASVVNATTFTIAYGASATATTYGGTVARVQGGNGLPGIVSQVVQSAAIASSVLTLTGSANWSGALIGDYVNVYGVRDNTTGADIGVDGVYRVRNVSTTALELEAIGSTVIPTTLASVNCGGVVIRRTDLRISFARLFDFGRQRVEMLPRPAGDEAASVPVRVNNSINAIQSTRGSAASGWYVNPDNLLVNDVASAAITSTATTSSITPGNTGGLAEFNVIVTAASGTNPTMDVGVEESDDSGTNWIRIYDFPRITATGAYRSPPLLLNGNRVRYVQTIGGSSPSFTRTVNRVMQFMMGSPNNTRQLIDRNIDANAAAGSSNTGSLLNGTGAANVMFTVQTGSCTTPAGFQLQGSFDGSTWYAIGSVATPASGQSVSTTVLNVPFHFYRVYLQAQGVGYTAGQQQITIRTF